MSKSFFSIDVKTRDLVFNFDAKTSRGSMQVHRVYYLILTHSSGYSGVGEIAPLPGLSPDFGDVNEEKIRSLAQNLASERPGFTFHEMMQLAEKHSEGLPSVRFGMETALLDWHFGGEKCILRNDFIANEHPIPINGLIWMNEPMKMFEEGKIKFEQGYRCLKLKIGATNWDTELAVLKKLRQLAPAEKLTLRLDANGAFNENNIWLVLDQLERLQIHSIEQPVKPGQYKLMAELCNFSPVPIAFDEELIGEQPDIQFFDKYIPQYLVLKPTLVGGLSITRNWIELAKQAGIGWWITSALESNIGLNAICQFTFENIMPGIEQGLGTGKLYRNNLESPLVVESGYIHYAQEKSWESLSNSD